MKKIIIALSLLFLPLFASASIDTNLYYGINNKPEVMELQEFFISKDLLTGPATGNFYSLTLGAAKKYQASVGINSTGYVGVLTRKSINDELVATLSDSDKEATSETGTTPPLAEPQKTTNDVVSGIQSQIALLQQQLNSLNTQAQTIQQIQQNTQQIVQNTTPVAPLSPSTPAPIVSAPAPQKELQVTNLTAGDVVASTTGNNCFTFQAFVLNDGGNYPIAMSSDKEPGQNHNFGIVDGKMQTSYCPGSSGNVTLTFSYSPLSLSKTLTLNVLAPNN